MELWNDGIVGFQRKLSILNFSVKMNFAICPILQYPKTHFSNIPAFHQSLRGRRPNGPEANWGEAPNLYGN
jgi:hypothetical protein